MAATIHQLEDAGLLTLGAKGEAVRQLQQQLNALRVTFLPVPETATYDLDTSNAVKAFQDKVGVPVTGSVDAETRKRLDESLKAMGVATQKTALAPPQARVAAPPQKMPLWKAGLIALGVIGAIAGAVHLLSEEEEKEKDEGKVATDDSVATSTLSGSEHVKPVKKPTVVKSAKAVQKCERTPADKGEVILA